MNILAVCGSLRRASINAAVLRVLKRCAPADVHVNIFAHAGVLPLFNPDVEPTPPPHVVDLYNAVASCNVMVIASPEYAHGVTGTMKNVLDWLVGFEPFMNKPVAILNAAPSSYHADAALRETLRTMSANIVEEASIRLPLVGLQRTEEGMMESQAVMDALHGVLASLRRRV